MRWKKVLHCGVFCLRQCVISLSSCSMTLYCNSYAHIGQLNNLDVLSQPCLRGFSWQRNPMMMELLKCDNEDCYWLFCIGIIKLVAGGLAALSVTITHHRSVNQKHVMRGWRCRQMFQQLSLNVLLLIMVRDTGWRRHHSTVWAQTRCFFFYFFASAPERVVAGGFLFSSCPIVPLSPPFFWTWHLQENLESFFFFFSDSAQTSALS